MKGLLAQSLREVGGGTTSSHGAAAALAKKVKPKSLQIFSRQFATMIDAGLNVVSALVILEDQTSDKLLSQVVHQVREDVEGGMILSQAMARHPKVFSRLYVAMVEAGEAAGMLDSVLDRVAFQIEKETQIKRRVKGAMLYPTLVLTFATIVLIGMLLFLVPVFPPMVSQMVKIGEETGELEQMLSKIADFYEDEVDTSIRTLTSIIEPVMMIGVGMMVGVIIIAMYLPMFKLLSLVK